MVTGRQGFKPEPIVLVDQCPVQSLVFYTTAEQPRSTSQGANCGRVLRSSEHRW